MQYYILGINLKAFDGLLVSFILTIIGGIFVFSEKLKENKKNNSPNNFNVASHIILLLGAITTLYFGYASKIAEQKATDKADSLIMVSERKHDTIITLNKLLDIKTDTISSLQHIQLDSIKHLLFFSLNSNLLQKQLNDAQSELYNQVTGGDHFEIPFYMYAIMDVKTYRPAMYNWDTSGTDPATIYYLQDLSKIYSRGTSKGVKLRKGQHSDLSFAFMELVECKLADDLASLERPGSTFIISSNGFDARTNNVIRLRHSMKISRTEILKAFEPNYFSKGIDDEWKKDSLTLPLDTKLSFAYYKGSEIKNDESQIKFEKKDFFTIIINIVPDNEISGMSPFKRLPLSPDLASNTATFSYKIVMTADFRQGGLPETNQYKKWAILLFNELRRINEH
jgi:hypothetical protein